MPSDTFSTAFRLGAPPAEAVAFLRDPHSDIELAPLVVAVRDIRAAADRTHYVAVERFRFGPFHWDNAISVTLTAAPGAVTKAVCSPGGVRLTATVTLTATGGGSRATETVELHTPWPLRSFALGKAREAQAGRVARLTARFPVL